jgi:hypothetical protein
LAFAEQPLMLNSGRAIHAEWSDVHSAVRPLRFIFWGGIFWILYLNLNFTTNGTGIHVDLLDVMASGHAKRPPECPRSRPGFSTKHLRQLGGAAESRALRDVGHRQIGGVQQALGALHAHAADLTLHCPPDVLAKRPPHRVRTDGNVPEQFDYAQLLAGAIANDAVTANISLDWRTITPVGGILISGAV